MMVRFEEAAMTTITNPALRKEQAQEQLKAALSAYREMLDTFVNNKAPQGATDTDRIAAAGISNVQSKSVKPHDRAAVDSALR
jgi:hypothetical protein